MAAVLPLFSERHRAAPKPALLWILGLAGVASCAVTAGLAAVNEELYQPALRVLLVRWITLPFVFAGIVAWRRRPDSCLRAIDDLGGIHHPALHPAVDEPAGTQHGRPAMRPTGRSNLAPRFPRLPHRSTRWASRASGGDHRICRGSRPAGRDLDAGRIQRSHLLTVSTSKLRRKSSRTCSSLRSARSP